MAADVAADVSFDPTRDPTRPIRILTRPGQRVNPVNGQTRLGQRPDPTRSTVNRVKGQARPGQRSTGSTVKPDPVNTPRPCALAATRCHTRRTFWWHVRARVRAFLGNFGTYRFVSKFSTMWYIDFACLKLLQI